MWKSIKKFQYKSATLIYGFVVCLAAGLFLQYLNCDLTICSVEHWFPRAGALLVCYSLGCVYLNHYLGPIQAKAEKSVESARQVHRNPRRAINAIVEQTLPLQIEASLQSVQEQLGQNVDLDHTPIQDSEKSIRELIEENVREHATTQAEASIGNMVDTVENEAAEVGRFRNLLATFEFTAAIVGTFVWGFGDLFSVQIIIGCLLFSVCLLRCLPSFADIFDDKEINDPSKFINTKYTNLNLWSRVRLARTSRI